MVDIIAKGLDYSAARIPAKAVLDAGYSCVFRYLWFPGQQHAYINAQEYLDLRQEGVGVSLIYEQNNDDPKGGNSAGDYMGRQAVASSQAIGAAPGTVIWMCSDAWLFTNKIPTHVAMSFLDGARNVVEKAGYRLGAYGFKDFINAAIAGNHADFFWLCGAKQTVAESEANPIHFWQDNTQTTRVAGVKCDINWQYQILGDFLMSLTDEQQTDLYESVKGIQKALGQYETKYQEVHGVEKTAGLAIYDIEKVLGDAYDQETGSSIGTKVRETLGLIEHPIGIELDYDKLATALVKAGLTTSPTAQENAEETIDRLREELND